MKILLISSYLPYPLYNGGNIRLYNLIKNLSKSHEVTLIAEVRPNQTKEDIKEVEKICKKVLTVPRKKQWSFENILKAGLSTRSFLITGHTLPAMQKIIDRELQSEQFDLIHVETFYVMQNLPKTTLPIVLVEHNIEYLVYERYSNKAPYLLRPLLRIDVNKIRREEESAWKKATVVATVSEDEKKIINQKNVYVVPNGVDMKQFQPKSLSETFSRGEKRILYIGDYKWVQNRDAAHFIIKQIWPRICEKWEGRKEKVVLWIVGRNMPASIKELGKGDGSIIFDDQNPKSTPEIFSEAYVLLAPKRVGGGTSYKTLEAMAVGTPVITNDLGLEGLEITRDRDVLVGNNPEELAQATIMILQDQEKYSELSHKGRKAVENTYDWSVITRELERVYQHAAS